METPIIFDPFEQATDPAHDILEVKSNTLTLVTVETDEPDKSRQCRLIYDTPQTALIAANYFVKRFKLRNYRIIFTPFKLIGLWESK